VAEHIIVLPVTNRQTTFSP